MAKVTGAARHRARLRGMRGPAVVRQVTRVLYATAQDIAVDAATSITEGATSGKAHVASAPGEPPNADTHVLSNSITASSPGPLRAEASADAPYAAAQEFGSDTANLPERPYMRPAAIKNHGKATKRVADAVSNAIRRAG